MRRLPILICSFVLLSAPARAELITLDFNVFPGTFRDLPGDDWSQLSRPYTPQHGIAAPGTGLIDTYFAHLYSDAQGAYYDLNGSGIMSILAAGTILTAGAPFSLVSVDVLPHYPAEIAGAHVRFSAMRGGAVVGVSDALIGRTDGWHTLDLTSLGLVDVIEITTFDPAEPHPQEFWVDNLTIHRAPEPLTLCLVLVGVGGLLVRARSARRR